MSSPDILGAARPKLALYLPHRPNGLEQLMLAPCAEALVAGNSNHWRKIVTLLAKVASPEQDNWRRFRDEDLFLTTALCFTPGLLATADWHWIGGKDNLRRFADLKHEAQPLTECPQVQIDPEMRLLLTPYPDYRQLSNAVILELRSALEDQGFYQQPG